MRIGPRSRSSEPAGRVLLRRWPALLGGLLIGLLLAGAVMAARPPVYRSLVVVSFDPQRYDLAHSEIPPLLEAESREMLALLSPADLNTSPRLPAPLRFRRAGKDSIQVIGQALSPERAEEIAAHGATALSEGLRSIRGWNLLHTLLRRSIYLQGHGLEDPSPGFLTPYLFDLLDAGFLTYDPSIPLYPGPVALSAQDVAEITLGVQRMHDRLTAHLNLLFGRRDREGNPDRRAQIEQEIATTAWKRKVLGETLILLYRYGEDLIAPEAPSAEGPAVGEAGPAEAVGLPGWTFLLIGGGAGLVLAAGLAILEERMGLLHRLREVLAYRDLIWNLVVRDLKARYKSSILGYLWSLVNPLLMMTVLTILFKFLLKSDIPNFPVFIIVALLPWNFCATAVSGAVVSITGQSNLIKKVYFPREVIPIAVVLANLINYLLALPAMFLIMVLLNAHFQPVIALFPLIALIQTIFLLGMALFLSCLNVFFRDTEVIMEVLLTAWFFLTPIFYRLGDIVDERLARLVRWLNPMASLVDFYRDIFYLGGMPGWDALIRTLVTALVILLVGYLFFLRFSPRFGEEV